MSKLQKTLQQRIADIKQFSSTNDEAIGQGRRLSWLLLGEIYANGLEIDADDDLRNELNLFVEKLPEMQKHPGWIPSEKSVFEVLLVAALGYDQTLAKRHYYNRACENARKGGSERPTSAEEFADWVQGKGGIMAAAKTASEHEKAEDAIKRLARKLKEKAPKADTEAQIEVPFAPKAGGESLGVLLVEQLADGKARVIGSTTRLAIVASVLKDINDEPSEAKRHKTEKEARWELNRVTEMLADVWRGTPAKEDFDLCKKAVENLAKDEILAGKYFEGEPLIEVVIEGTRLKDQNGDAHPLDPARYIKNAKLFTLPPFDIKGIDPTSSPEVMKKKLDEITGYKHWKTSRPRDRTSGQ